jgi:hypothetical protein
MLNYTEKTQNTYVQSWTVYGIMVIENGGLPSVARTIAVSWPSYLSMLTWNAYPCIFSRWYSTRSGLTVSGWCTELPQRRLSYPPWQNVLGASTRDQILKATAVQLHVQTRHCMTFTKPSTVLLCLIPGKRNRSSLKTIQSAHVKWPEQDGDDYIQSCSTGSVLPHSLYIMLWHEYVVPSTNVSLSPAFCGKWAADRLWWWQWW